MGKNVCFPQSLMRIAMKKTRTENRDVDEAESGNSRGPEVFPSDAFDDFIQEENKLRESEGMIPRHVAPKPTLTLTLDKNCEITSQ